MWQQQLSVQELMQEREMPGRAGSWSRCVDCEEAGAEEAEEMGQQFQGRKGRKLNPAPWWRFGQVEEAELRTMEGACSEGAGVFPTPVHFAFPPGHPQVLLGFIPSPLLQEVFPGLSPACP